MRVVCTRESLPQRVFRLPLFALPLFPFKPLPKLNFSRITVRTCVRVCIYVRNLFIFNKFLISLPRKLYTKSIMYNIMRPFFKIFSFKSCNLFSEKFIRSGILIVFQFLFL